MNELFPVTYSYLIPLLPMLGAVIVALFGAKVLKGQSHWPIWLGVGASAVLSLWLLWAMLTHEHNIPDAYPGLRGFALATKVHYFTWIQAGRFTADAAFWIDPLTAVMLCVVCGIGWLITIF